MFFSLGSLTDIRAPALLWRTWSRDRVGQCKLMGAILTVSDSVFIRGRLSINCQIACQTLQCLHWFASNQLIGILNKLATNSIVTSISRFKLKYFYVHDCLQIDLFSTKFIFWRLALPQFVVSWLEQFCISPSSNVLSYCNYYFKGFHDKVCHLNKYMVFS